MSSRPSHSRIASSRSQSQIWRCTSGSDTRRRSGRGGKSPPRSARAGSLLPLLPLLPDQEAVRQHHAHRVPVEARTTAAPGTGPSPAAPWLPRDTAPPSAAGGRTPPSSPAAPPARSCSSSTAACRRRHPPRSASRPAACRRPAPASSGPPRTGPAASPCSPPASGSVRHDRCRLRRDQPRRPAAAARRPAARATAKSERTATTWRSSAVLQAHPGSWGCRRSRRRPSRRRAGCPRPGLVEQGQGDLRLGLEGDLLGHVGLRAGGRDRRPIAGAGRAGWPRARRGSARRSGS